MIKRLAAILLCLLMIFAFTGCGKDKDKDKDSEILAPMDLEDTAQVKFVESAKGTTIRKVGELETMDDYGYQATLEFMEKYDIEIDWIPGDYNTYISQLPQLVASGNPPDTGVLSSGRFLSFYYGNLCMPINDYLAIDDPYWDKEVLEAFSVNGNYYGVNTGEIEEHFIYYNKTLFEEEGIEDPYELYEKGEWTFAKLREIAKKATIYADDGVTVETYGIGTYQRQDFILAQGADFIKYNVASGEYESNLSSPAVIAGLNYYKDLIADGSFNPGIHGYSQFPARQIAMFIESPMNAISNNDLLNNMKDEIGIVPFPPSIVDGKSYAPTNSISNCVPTNSQNPAGGMLWNHYWVRRLADGEKSNNETWYNRRYKMMTEAHEEVIVPYREKTPQITTFFLSITNISNYENIFWGDISKGTKTAEELTASMENVIRNALDRLTSQ